MLRLNSFSQEHLSLEQLLKPYVPYKSTMIDIIHESCATPFLHAIDVMPQKIFGLNPSLATKFKALLTIIAFNLLSTMKKWADAELSYTNSFLAQQAEKLADLIHDPNNISRDQEFSQITRHLKNYLKLRAFVYSSEINFNENNFDADIAKIAAEFHVDNNDLQATTQKIFDMLVNAVYYWDISSIRKTIKKFDLTQLNSTIQRNANLNIAVLCSEHGLQNSADALTQINDLYISTQLDFEAFLDTVISRMDNSLHVDKNILSKLYENAFAYLHNRKAAYYKHLAIEFYLQQLRKPEYRSEIFALIDTSFLPGLTFYYKTLGKDKTIDIHKMSEWAIRISQTDSLLLSLHQCLDKSYQQLFSPHISVIADNFDDDEDHRISPILSVDSNALPDQLFTNFTPHKEVKPLFREDIVGRINKDDIELLNLINLEISHYKRVFENLNQRADISNENLRAAAVTTFQDYLSNAVSIHAIAALLEVAEPYINVHRNQKTDERLGINITKTWSKMIKQARSNGMDILKKEVSSASDNNARLDTLEYWRNKNLFARHRSNFKITGSFGRTNAQAEIDNMTKRMRKS